MVNKSIKKIDSEAIITGKPIYTEDLILHKDALVIKLLRSQHAFAKIKSINIDTALRVEGIVGIYTYKDVPNIRYSMCGESYPEASPYDQLILEDTVRYVGDEVAIIAAENENAALKAMKLIKVEYEKLKPIFDPKEALDSEIIIHQEDDVHLTFDFGYNSSKNIVSKYFIDKGDIEKELRDSDVIVEESYRTQPQAHCMMETHRAYTYIDSNGRLVIVSANQSAYHMRRQVARAIGIPMSKIRVIKPRIGGGFGGKNIAVTEIYTAFVTWKTKRAAKLIYTRKETFSATNTRHGINFDVKIGSDKNGNIKAISMKALNNTGAYGDNGPAVTMEAGHNVLPTYNDINAIRYEGTTVYTNLVPAGALRGYGATQGTFALDCSINELATKLNMDPIELKLKNIVKINSQGGALHSPIRSCKLEECIKKGKEIIGWDKKYPLKEIGDGKVRSVGMAICNHGSGIANIDMAIVTAKMDEDGTFKIFTGSSDLGTGSDTVLTQMAAGILSTSIDNISLYSGDSDMCPYDTGAYASCTTYVTGNATVKACESLKLIILKEAQKKLHCPLSDLELVEDRVYHKKCESLYVTLRELGAESVSGGNKVVLSSTEQYGIEESAKPFVAGFVEIELDKNTGEFKVINYVACIDCGTVINPALARIQAEGGITQGIGMAMYEDPLHDSDGRLITNNLLQYKVPTRKDIGNIHVEFIPNYEPTGPFGAKSLGEVVVHTPSPAIANAIYNATGANVRELPITSEKVYMAMKKRGMEG